MTDGTPFQPLDTLVSQKRKTKHHPPKARPASRAFPMSKTEYELSMIIIFLVFRQNTVFIGNNLFGEGLVERDSEVWRALEGFSSLPELFIYFQRSAVMEFGLL